MSNETSSPNRRGSLLAVFLAVFIDLLGFGIVLPLLPIYGKAFAGDMNDATRGLIVGLLMSSFSAMQFVFSPIWGKLSDRVGRRPIILLGLAGSVLFYALLGVATMYRSLAGLFIARIGAGVCGATIATAQAYIADTTSAENRTKGMALIGAAFALGFTLGPLIGAAALLAGGGGEFSPWPGFAAAILSGAALAYAYGKLPESLHRDSQTAARTQLSGSVVWKTLATPATGCVVLASFIYVFAFGGLESTVSLLVDAFAARHAEDSAGVVGYAPLENTAASWAKRFGDPEQQTQIAILIVYAVIGITLAVAQGFLVRRLASKLSEITLATTGAVIGVAAFGGMAYGVLQNRFDATFIAILAEVVGFAFVAPSLQSLLSRRADPAQQGAVLGVSQSASSLARILGPILMLWLFGLRISLPYLTAAVMMSAGLLLIFAAAKTKPARA